MAALSWDTTGTHYFETGVDHGVLYVDTNATINADIETWPGYAWNGLTGVTESPSGAEDTTLWADNIKYLTLTSAEEFGLTVTCYTYPDQWMWCDGSRQPAAVPGLTLYQQERRKFGLYYRTKIGNDVVGDALGYKHHIAYGCSASTSERGYSTVNDSPEAIEFSYEVSTTPVDAPTGYKPTSLVTIDDRQFDTTAKATKLTNCLELLLGNSSNNAFLRKPSTIINALT